MKLLLITVVTLFLCSCNPEHKKPHEVSTSADAENKLHGVWESTVIFTKEPNPPKKVTLKVTTYNNSKLIWLQMISESAKGAKNDITIQVESEKRNNGTFLVPVARKQLEKSEEEKDKKFINYNPKHRKEVKGLEWRYDIIEGNRLRIQMGISSITFKRIK